MYMSGAFGAFPDLEGFPMLCSVLAEPFEGRFCVTLSGQTVNGAMDRAQADQTGLTYTTNVTSTRDDEARIQHEYEACALELCRQIEDADRVGDKKASARALAELEQLVRVCEAERDERARDRSASPLAAVSQATGRKIRRTYRPISVVSAWLVEHLRRSIHAGVYVSYRPDFREPVVWRFGPPTVCDDADHRT
jgi:hypothetical protein